MVDNILAQYIVMTSNLARTAYQATELTLYEDALYRTRDMCSLSGFSCTSFRLTLDLLNRPFCVQCYFEKLKVLAGVGHQQGADKIAFTITQFLPHFWLTRSFYAILCIFTQFWPILRKDQNKINRERQFFCKNSTWWNKKLAL